MNLKEIAAQKKSYIENVTKFIWFYHLVSAGVGIILLSPLLYVGVKEGNLKQSVTISFLMVLFIPYLFITLHFLKFKKWAYWGILLIYFGEIISIEKVFELKLSLFHYAIVLSFGGWSFGVDVVSSLIVIFLLLVGRDYLGNAQ